jgi:hypothetical protein
MTNTNHNVWTLTVHVAKSLNQKAGRLDTKLYGHTVVPDKPNPPSEPFNWDAFFVVFGIVAFFVVLVYFIPNLRKNL